MKKLLLLFVLLVPYGLSFAGMCPNDHDYEEYQSYGKPDNDKEKQMLIDKMSKELKAKFPNTYIHCGLRDNKYIYCAACKDA